MPLPPAIKYLTDVHCHPTELEISAQVMEDLPLRIAAMSSRFKDQPLVADMATRWPDKVAKLDHYAALFLPGVPVEDAMQNTHFANLFESLPDPKPLSEVLASVRNNLERFPNALLGEVGLDRSFRIPYLPFRSHAVPAVDTETDDDDDLARRLSPFHVPLEHQMAILEAQFDLAIECKRGISLHSVKSQQASADLLKRLAERYGDEFYNISVDFHSCGLSDVTWREIQKVHPNVYLSLSIAINARSPTHQALIEACDPTRLLVESDEHTLTRSAQMTWDMLEIIANIRGWRVEQSPEDVMREDGEPGAVRRLMLNWDAFLRGGHQRPQFPAKDSNKIRKRNRNQFPRAEEDWDDDEGEGEIGSVVYLQRTV